MEMTHMIANESTNASRRIRRLAGVVGLPLMGWIDGAAHAATSSRSTAVTSTTTAPAAVRPRTPADTATPVRAGEKTLTCAHWATAKAGALKAVPCGADYRVETDADGASYEAFMTKAATAANASMPQSLQE
jgi:hypothetical protein